MKALSAILQSLPLWNSIPLQTDRPDLVLNALENGEPIYYFGLGSNMLRSKLQNRSSQGEIEFLSMEPAIVSGHRLAFNLKGFAPLEPGMGSLEPCNSSSKPLLAYQHEECHGALIQLTPEMYQRVMQSEGVGTVNATRPSGYEEVVVTARPYAPGRPAVQAVSLRARSHVRLSRDPSPSTRYMTILREGAAELGLQGEYQDFLHRHPVQVVPRWLRRIAVYNLICSFRFRLYSRIQSWLLWRVYCPSTVVRGLELLSNACMAAILLPGSLLGWVLKRNQAEVSPFLTRIMALLDEDSTKKPREEQQSKNETFSS